MYAASEANFDRVIFSGNDHKEQTPNTLALSHFILRHYMNRDIQWRGIYLDKWAD